MLCCWQLLSSSIIRILFDFLVSERGESHIAIVLLFALYIIFLFPFFHRYNYFTEDSHTHSLEKVTSFLC